MDVREIVLQLVLAVSDLHSRNCIGVFQDYYQTHQLSQYSPSEIAWIPALQVFFMLFGSPFVGKIFDDYGPRYLLAGGTFLHVFGTWSCYKYGKSVY